MQSAKFVSVYSDNFDAQIFTLKAYQELRLQMSTGDFHMHKALTALPACAAHFGYTDVTDDGEFIDVP